MNSRRIGNSSTPGTILICQYYDKVSLDKAKELVQQDAAAKVRFLQEQRVSAMNVVNDDDDAQPFKSSEELPYGRRL